MYQAVRYILSHSNDYLTTGTIEGYVEHFFGREEWYDATKIKDSLRTLWEANLTNIRIDSGEVLYSPIQEE